MHIRYCNTKRQVVEIKAREVKLLAAWLILRRVCHSQIWPWSPPSIPSSCGRSNHGYWLWYGLFLRFYDLAVVTKGIQAEIILVIQ